MSLSAEIIELGDKRPHIVLDCTAFGGGVEVFPLRLAINWLNGSVLLPEDAVLKTVIRAWLHSLT